MIDFNDNIQDINYTNDKIKEINTNKFKTHISKDKLQDHTNVIVKLVAEIKTPKKYRNPFVFLIKRYHYNVSGYNGEEFSVNIIVEDEVTEEYDSYSVTKFEVNTFFVFHGSDIQFADNIDEKFRNMCINTFMDSVRAANALADKADTNY